MGTPRQIESARINGAKSRGPVTAEGKRRSSANARKHGLASKQMTSDPETLAVFDARRSAYIAGLQPNTPAEFLVIDRMAAAKTRQHQARAAEAAAWNRALAAHDGAVAVAFHALAESGELACILRYQTRFHREYYRALKDFLALRAAPTNAVLPNEPEPPAPNPSPKGDFSKRTGFEPRPRCAHLTFLRNEPDSRAAPHPPLPAFDLQTPPGSAYTGSSCRPRPTRFDFRSGITPESQRVALAVS